jgi:hypothetical protein
MTTPTLTRAPVPHRQSITEASVAMAASGATVASLHHFAATAFPAQTAAVTAVVLAAIAAARKELPYVAKILLWARALRKNAAVTNSSAYKALAAEVDALKTQAPAPVLAVASEVAKDVVAAAETAPVATTPPPASGGVAGAGATVRAPGIY